MVQLMVIPGTHPLRARAVAILLHSGGLHDEEIQPGTPRASVSYFEAGHSASNSKVSKSRAEAATVRKAQLTF